MCSACSQFNFSCWRTKRPQGRHSTWWLLQKDLAVESATFHAVQDVKVSACNMNSRANLALLASISIGRLGPTFPKQVEVDNFTSCWGQSIFSQQPFLAINSWVNDGLSNETKKRSCLFKSPDTAFEFCWLTGNATLHNSTVLSCVWWGSTMWNTQNKAALTYTVWFFLKMVFDK